jgi:hypothetical protein
MPETFDVFLSHNSRDKPTVERIGDRLKERGLRVWFDKWELRPGSRWQRGLAKAIASSGAVAVLIGEQGLGPWAKLEMEASLHRSAKQKLQVIPVLLPGAPEEVELPEFLDLYGWVDLRGGIDDGGIDRLFWGITGLKTSTTSTLNERATWNVPYPRNPYFAGREDVLKELRETLTHDRSAALGQALAISGLGGIGKTQTAVEYAYRYRDAYQAVFFVRADSESELISGYSEIAHLLDLPEKDAQDQDAVVAGVLRRLEMKESWLLILDNADRPELAKPFIPRSHAGHVLVTSRAQVFDLLGIPHPFRLQTLPPEDALAFLLKRADREGVSDPEDRRAAVTLAEELGFLPLALEQAGAYVLARHTRFQDYLASFKHHGLDLLRRGQPVMDGHPDPIATTWAMNFEGVGTVSAAAADVLRASAFLSPDDIPLELLTEGAAELGAILGKALADGAGDPLVIDEVIEPLTRYSLIDRNVHTRTYSVHRLVQAVLRQDLGDVERRLWAERVVKALNRVFPDVEFETWPLCDRLLPHAKVAAELMEDLSLEVTEGGRLLNQAGYYAAERARFAEAEPLYRRALAIDEKSFGQDHPDVAIDLNNLATLLKATNRLSEAEPLMRRALAIDEKSFGQDHPDVAIRLNNLAQLLQATNRLSEAEPLMRRALAIDEKSFGQDHPDVAIDLNNLAQLLKATNRLSEAEPLMSRALAIFTKSLGEDHPRTQMAQRSFDILLEAMAGPGPADGSHS